MGKVDRLQSKVQNGVNRINQYAEGFNDATDIFKMGEEILNYWSAENSEEREKLQKEVERIKKRQKKMKRRFIILWITIILITVFICAKV